MNARALFPADIATPLWSFEDERAVMADRLARDMSALRGARLFVTGGTGFIGRWLLEALRAVDLRLDLGIEVTLLTRDPDSFAARQPHLANHRGVRLVAGDILDLMPGDTSYTHIIHAATDASAALTAADPRRMFDTIVGGTHRLLDFAQSAGHPRILFLSSGAVYGAQPWEVARVGEDAATGPDVTNAGNAYAEGKRAAEMLCAVHAQQYGLDIVTARIFAVLGPLLSLDTHFAAGNFIRDAMAGKPITVQGSGQAVRSYLYAADLAVWLWTMLLRAPAGTTYNVGSEHPISIADLARRTGAVLGGGAVDVLGQPDPGWNPGRYVPSTARVRAELGVSETVDLDTAILRTALWNGWVAP